MTDQNADSTEYEATEADSAYFPVFGEPESPVEAPEKLEDLSIADMQPLDVRKIERRDGEDQMAAALRIQQEISKIVYVYGFRERQYKIEERNGEAVLVRYI